MDPQETTNSKEGECYFCGSPNPSVLCARCHTASYCSQHCRQQHWDLEASDCAHKAQCEAYCHQEYSGSIDEADYHSYIASLPCCAEEDKLQYLQCARRDPSVVQFCEDIVGYPIGEDGPHHWRLHEFLNKVVAHGEDTEDFLAKFFGFAISHEDRDRNILEIMPDFPVGSDWTTLPCDKPIACQDQSFGVCQGRCRRRPRPWFESIGRAWFEARITVACGVGAAEGTHAYAMGAHAPLPLPEGVPASPRVVEALQKLCVPVEQFRLERPQYDDICIVCHGSFEADVQVLPCGHVFHQSCIRLWLEKNANCPVCRNYIPETIPRPSTRQERNMAARLFHHQQQQATVAASDGGNVGSNSLRKPLSEEQLLSWKGGFINMVRVLFPLSDALEGVSGGEVHIAVAPSGREVAVTSTSIGKVAFISTASLSLLNGTVKLGKEFPGGPRHVVYDRSDQSETSIIVVVDETVDRYERHRVQKHPGSNKKSLALKRSWSVPHQEDDEVVLSMDISGRVLVSGPYAPNFTVRSSDGKGKALVPYDHVGGGNNPWFSPTTFHGKCLRDQELPSQDVLILPSGDIVFPKSLAIRGERGVVSLGILCRGENRIKGLPIEGLERSVDILTEDWTLSKFCVNPGGDIFVAVPSEILTLIRITNPTTHGGGPCRGTCTKLRGFRAFEEIEGLAADNYGCVYLLVVCNWPAEREIYLVNPKP